MKKLLCPLLIAAWLTSGCASTQLPKPQVSIQSPRSDMSGLKTFYVSREHEAGAENERHLQGLHAVQAALADHGMPAASGLLSAMPTDTGCKVIIRDHWFWDTYWYLLS